MSYITKTNYEAIIEMDPMRMQTFLDEVYIAGLNTGGYAAGLEYQQQTILLSIIPFNMEWLHAPAESALLSKDEKIDIAAAYILEKHRAAFEELAT